MAFELVNNAKIARTSREIARVVGSKIGRRIVLGEAPRAHYDTGRGMMSMAMVSVMCECGQRSQVLWSALKAGRANSCWHCSPKYRKKKTPCQAAKPAIQGVTGNKERAYDEQGQGHRGLDG